ncbi:MAG: cation:proton antiporter [Rhizobiales bacterium]|nr:cation:proton antiporter [Hyphomicrobiales bacterium]
MSAVPGAESLFTAPLVFLAAAVIAVPIFKKLGLGSVLGYLAAGIIIGPVLGLIVDGESILRVAELGVVLLLFIIGLELKPSRLWEMRKDILGLGAVQVIACGIALTAIIYASGRPWQVSLVVGLGLALSSTAIAMQILEERGEAHGEYGQKSFSILLFQDLAIVPLLALVAFLAPSSSGEATSTDWGEIGTKLSLVIVCVAALILIGRYLLSPMFQLLADAKASEIMTAAALLVVLGAAALMEFAGMSSAMGAFIAGVMLAESSFRHELEANIEPFRGLLMGLFFMAVGMSLDLAIVADNLWLILGAAIAFMATKGAIIYGLSRFSGLVHATAIRIASVLPQHGEFAFVLFTSAAGVGLLSLTDASILAAVTTLTMALTPLTVALAPRFIPATGLDEIEEDFSTVTGTVILISFGRFGQVVSQLLLAEGIDVTIIDSSASRIRSAAKFGFKIYYGDGRRLEVLRAAGLDNAQMVIVCTNHENPTTEIVELVKKHAPSTKVYVRSYDRGHSISLRRLEVDFEIRESVESAFKLGAEALNGLHTDSARVHEIVRDIRRRDAYRLALQVDGDINDGLDTLHTNAAPTPEPLQSPKHAAKPLNKETGDLVEKTEADQG